MRLKGSLFELAEKQLQKEKADGTIPCYTLSDILDYAITVRQWLDNNENKVSKVLKLTKEDKRKRNNKARMMYYLKHKK